MKQLVVLLLYGIDMEGSIMILNKQLVLKQIHAFNSRELILCLGDVIYLCDFFLASIEHTKVIIITAFIKVADSAKYCVELPCYS